jgi:2-dehydropantoate 2-reductase
MQGRIHNVPTPVNEALQRIAAEAARAGVTPGAMPMDELVARVQSHVH